MKRLQCKAQAFLIRLKQVKPANNRANPGNPTQAADMVQGVHNSRVAATDTDDQPSRRASPKSLIVQADGSYTRRFQGTGLGLSIARRMVEAMGGKIALESVEGEGTTVRFDIKVGIIQTQTPERLATEKRISPSAATSQLRILAVEDDAMNLKVVRGFLEKLEYAVAGASTGREALDILQRERFDLILMDVQMPEMDGVEATRRIRDGKAGANNLAIPIVALTAYTMTGDREKFLEAGMDDYLAKPVSLEKLKEVLAGVMAK